MNILGIDYSKNSPSVVILELDDNLDVVDLDYISFTSVKKTYNLDTLNLKFYHKDHFKDDYHKAQTHRDDIDSFIDDLKIEYAAFEGYAFAAKGKVFDIAEATACLKFMLYDYHIPMRFYDPNTIKMFATSKGNADKKAMQDHFDKTVKELDLSHLPQYKNPKEDIVDAYFTAKLLQMELKLRRGIIHTRDLQEHEVKVFNRCTKSNPENILVRDFIQKEGV